MANTYYDSELTAEEIEEVLEAINGILNPANNGKVLAVSNGKLEARSVQWGGGSAVLEPLSVTENGDYYPEAGVDGFDEVHVAVPSSSPTIESLSVTQNGTYTAPSGVDGYSPVVVNVSGGGGNTPIPLVVTTSSTYSSSPKQPSGIFGDIEGNFWGSGGRSNWLNINFGVPFVLKIVQLSNYYRVSSSTYWYSSSITVRASNDGFLTYTDLYTGTSLPQSDTQFEIDLNNSTAYIEYRFIVSDATAYAGLGRVELVQESSGTVVQPLSVTQNGTYNPPSGVDGYAPVVVNVSGGGPIEEWDFKESFIGKERGIEISATNVVRDSSGAIFDNTADYLTIPIRVPSLTMEIDVGTMNLESGTHRRFVMRNNEEGFIYRSNGKWSLYNGSWATDSEISDGDFFENSTIKIVVDSSYYWHVYKDNVLVYEPNRPLMFSNATFFIGAWQNSINNAVIEGLRIL